MSVKFPDNEEDFNNEFDAAVKGGYNYILTTFVFETLYPNIKMLSIS